MKDEKTKSQLFKGLADFSNRALKIEERCKEWLQIDETRTMLASIVENSDDAILSKTLDGIVTSWNHAAENMYGYTADEIIGKHVSILVPPEHSDEMPRILDIIKNGGRIDHFETRRITRDGRTIYVSLTVSPMKDRSGKIIGASTISRDTTQRRQMEEELRKSKAILARAQFIAHVGNLALDITTGDMRWSDEVFRIYGFQPQEFKPNHSLFIEKVHPDDRKKVTKSINMAFNENKLFNIDFRIVRQDGSIRYVNTEADKVRREADGRPLWLYGIIQDITERKLVEKRLRDAKAQSELYVDIMGHDINNLNQSSLGNLELIQDDGNLSKDQKECITDALNAIRGSANIIDNVRKVQAISEERMALHSIDINDMMLECIREVPNPGCKKVTINYESEGGLMIKGSPLMKEVFCNIIGNSVKYSADEVVVDISIERADRAGKKFYEVSIADNGYGIPDVVKLKLFNRFQRGTTKAHGKGLGLFIVKSLLERVEGSVTIEDRVPNDYTKGVKFIVSLPICEECNYGR
jgi:PAS domain S-box-containing protein